MFLDKFIKNKLIHPPEWLYNNLVLLNRMGSTAYGTNSDTSDQDFYGVVIPPKRIVFPWSNGHIAGFEDGSCERFDQWQEHHIKLDGNVYDFQVFNIVKYFQLLTDGNPNCIDSIFVYTEDVVFSSKAGQHIRENRKIFLSKKLYHKFAGYAASQIHNINTKQSESRKHIVDKYGWDVKYGMHLVRLLLSARDLLAEGDLDIKRYSQELRNIRNGEVSKEEVFAKFDFYKKELDNLYITSKLPQTPRYPEIKKILLECLEMQYGSLDKLISPPESREIDVLRQMKALLKDY